jgi:hypothetical protein
MCHCRSRRKPHGPLRTRPHHFQGCRRCSRRRPALKHPRAPIRRLRARRPWIQQLALNRQLSPIRRLLARRPCRNCFLCKRWGGIHWPYVGLVADVVAARVVLRCIGNRINIMLTRGRIDLIQAYIRVLILSACAAGRGLQCTEEFPCTANPIFFVAQADNWGRWPHS